MRTIHVETLDETSLGELMMHFFLETIIAARLLGVDAFDQPAVEEGKVLAKQYLAGELTSSFRHRPRKRATQYTRGTCYDARRAACGDSVFTGFPAFAAA